MQYKPTDYIATNQDFWEKSVAAHAASDFYDMPAFLSGKSSLNSIELQLINDIKNKNILHLQCHFGQDTLSLQRMGAQVLGVDFSPTAIATAQQLNQKLGLQAQFVCSTVYDAPQHLTQKFDVVFASYGTIGWLPDINQWAQVVSHFLKPGGKLVFVEFHPFVWIFNNDFSEITYHYHNHSPIVETTTGSYAAPKNPAKTTQITHNHSLSEVINALINNGLTINIFEEYNYSPYNCFEGTQQIAEGKYVIQKFGDKIPMVYAIVAQKNA